MNVIGVDPFLLGLCDICIGRIGSLKHVIMLNGPYRVKLELIASFCMKANKIRAVVLNVYI